MGRRPTRARMKTQSLPLMTRGKLGGGRLAGFLFSAQDEGGVQEKSRLQVLLRQTEMSSF